MPPVLIRSNPGVMRDTTRFNTGSHTDALWARWGADGLPRKISGYRRITDSLDGIATGLHRFSRNGETYFHIGTSAGIQQVRINGAGAISSIINRTPSITSANSAYAWKFQVMYDPVINNAASIIAHAAVNLNEMDVDTQGPAFFGDLTGSAALVPLSVPISESSTTITTVTGTTSNTFPEVTSVSATTALRFGQTVTGTGIPTGTYIASVDSASQITLSAEATASNVGTTLTITTGGACGGIVALYPYLFMYGSSGRIRHSTSANFNDFWTLGSNEAFITGQKIVQAMPTRGGAGNNPSGLFWSLDSLVRCNFVGGDAIFNFDVVSEGITVMSPRSIVEFDGVFYWLGSDRFFMYAGALREVQNTFNLDYLFANLNQTYKSRSFAYRNSRHGEIWWCVPLGVSTWPNHAFVYNVKGNFWYDTPLPESGRSCAEPALTFPYPIMGGVDLVSGAATYPLWQHEYGTDKVEGVSVTPIRSYFQTGDITLLEGQQPMNKELQVVEIEPDFVQTGDMTVTVVGNANSRAVTVENDPVTFSDDPEARNTTVNVKQTRRQMRFRFESNTAGGDYKAGKILAHLNPTGGRSR